MTITEGGAHIPVEAAAEATIVTKTRAVEFSALCTWAAHFSNCTFGSSRNQRFDHGVAVKVVIR
jgi:hypothetical protein